MQVTREQVIEALTKAGRVVNAKIWEKDIQAVITESANRNKPIEETHAFIWLSMKLAAFNGFKDIRAFMETKKKNESWKKRRNQPW